MRHLAERLVTFDYGYNMMCPGCPEVTALTSAEYYSQDNGAHVTCAHCGADIHFGPAVMTLRDADDPVLDDHQLSAVAWYHTSTNDRWPIGTHAMPAAAIEFLKLVMPADAVHRARDRHEDQALHLGTYEAAIESMLRRMRDQDDGGSQFYLYRVALHRDGLVIEPGWRDENSSEAAQITQVDLGDADGVRYLNVHESPGSISLAVRRKAIAWVRSISLPASAPNVAVTPDLLTEVARIGNEIYQLIEDEYLPDISNPVRAQFAHALHCWRVAQEITENDADFIHQFASMAATLTRPSEVLRLLDTHLCG